MPRRPSIKKKVKPLTDDELGRASLDYTVIFCKCDYWIAQLLCAIVITGLHSYCVQL